MNTMAWPFLPASLGSRHWRAFGFLVIFLFALGLRLQGLGAIITADEPQWIFRAQSFYRALERGDPGGTFQGTHPGVIAMLLIGGGVTAQERLTGTALESPRVGTFRTAAKLPIALATAAAITLAAALTAVLFEIRTGMAAGVLLGANPFLLGHSQLAHVDALLASLVLVAALGLLIFRRSRETRWLLFSATCGGMALLTKLPAVVLFALVPIALAGAQIPWRHVLRATGIWWGTAAALFLLLWPSMWLNLAPNIRYLRRDVETVATTPHRGEAAEAGQRGTSFYLRALVARTSPAILPLAVAGVWVAWRRGRRQELLLLLLVAGGLGILLTLVEKKADRYLLPSIAALDVPAAVAVSALLASRRAGRALAVLIVGGTVLQAVLLAPHAVAYVSPLAWEEEPTQSGWGEGLEQAAALLNAHPLAKQLVVASWYPSVFQEFFRGATMSLSSRGDHRVTHVVLYRNMRGRAEDSAATDILREFAEKKPAAVITVLGQEMAWVYETGTRTLYPDHVGEIVSAGQSGTPGTTVEVGAFLKVATEELAGVRIAFATFSSRRNSGRVLLHVREDPEGPDIRQVSVPMQQLTDETWSAVTFDRPITGREGKRLYVSVTSPDGRVGDAVTIRFQTRDFRDAEAVVLRAPLRAGERREDHRRTGEVAVELF